MIIAKKFSDINLKSFNKLIKNNGYIIIRGLFKEKEIREHLKILRKNFKAKEITRQVLGVMGNNEKLSKNLCGVFIKNTI